VPAFASTTAPPIVVWGSDNVARTMAYTAFNNNGQVEKNPDFEITQNNVVSIVSNGKLTLLSTNGLAFSNAQITDANQKQPMFL
jgi:ABC-type hemin transport system substrate-binding protein